MIAMPLALLALSWALAVVAGRARWRSPLSAVLGLLVGGLIIGALYPANLSDTYTYLLIGIIAIGYAIWRYAPTSSIFTVLHSGCWRGDRSWFVLSHYLYSLIAPGTARPTARSTPGRGRSRRSGLLSHPLDGLPVHRRFLDGVGNTRVDGDHACFLAAKIETLSALIEGALVMFVLALLALNSFGKTNVWLDRIAYCGMGRCIAAASKSMPDAKRFVLFLIGTALFITIVVEVVVV